MIITAAVTLSGRFGIAVTVPLALACYRTPTAYGVVTTTYGVGTTSDPALTGPAYAARAILESQANPFSRKCLSCGQAKGHAVSLEACTRAYVRTL